MGEHYFRASIPQNTILEGHPTRSTAVFRINQLDYGVRNTIKCKLDEPPVQLKFFLRTWYNCCLGKIVKKSAPPAFFAKVL